MDKQEIAALAEKYRAELGEDPNWRDAEQFLRSNGAISIDHRTGLRATHWKKTIYSYFQIHDPGDPKEVPQLESLISEEIRLTNALKENHLNLLMNIFNNELELEIR